LFGAAMLLISTVESSWRREKTGAYWKDSVDVARTNWIPQSFRFFGTAGVTADPHVP